MKKSLKVSFLSLIYLLSVLLQPGLVHAYFRDVTQENPYLPAVTYFEKLGVVQGNQGLFYPDRPITRAEFIKILVGKVPDSEDMSYIRIPFPDVAETAWYAPYIKWALKKSVLQGGSTELSPGATISWLETVLYLYRNYKNAPQPSAAVQIHKFPDLGKALPPMTYIYLEQALLDKLLVPESPGRLGLYRTPTRGEAVNFLYQAKTLYQDTEWNTGLLDTYILGKVSPEVKDAFLSVYQRLHEDYLYKDGLDDTELAYGAIMGMVQSLKDPYSEFFPPEQSASFLQTVTGDFEGIGAYVEVVNGEIKIIAPLKSSPAEKAGLLADDTIISVDGVPVEGMSLADVVGKIRGLQGTSVKLEIRRKDVAGLLEFTITRERVVVASVEYKALESNIAYFSLSQFLPTTASDFDRLYRENVTTPPKGLILDLRNNPGGYLDVVVLFLENFLKSEEVIVQIKDTQSTQKILSEGEGQLSTIPTVVLINKGSASASEIAAVALQDYKRATLVGETSFGKGLVQQLFQFGDNSSLKLTISEWLSPLGNSVNKKGVVPEVVIKNDPTNKTVDAQLNEAIRLLR